MHMQDLAGRIHGRACAEELNNNRGAESSNSVAVKHSTKWRSFTTFAKRNDEDNEHVLGVSDELREGVNCLVHRPHHNLISIFAHRNDS